MSVLEVVNVSREVTWLPWAVQYFFLIGISVACFTMSLPGYLSESRQALPLARVALVGALVCGLVAPVALLADLHQPGRFWRFYAHPNLGSWMAWGAFFIPGYLAGLMVFAWAALKPELAQSGRGDGLVPRLHALIALGTEPVPGVLKLAAAFTAAMGLLVLLYTGMELMVVRARPLWSTPFLPLQLVATSVVGSAGLVLVLDRVTGEHDGQTERTASRWLMWGLVSTIVLGAAWLAVARLGLSSTHADALASVSGLRSWRLSAIWLATAVMVPLVLVWLKPAGLGWLVGLIGLHAAWMFRWTVFIGGQTLPKTGAGEYSYHLPLGHNGLLGVVGTAGLWLAAFIIITALLPGRSPAQSARPALATTA